MPSKATIMRATISMKPVVVQIEGGKLSRVTVSDSEDVTSTVGLVTLVLTTLSQHPALQCVSMVYTPVGTVNDLGQD